MRTIVALLAGMLVLAGCANQATSPASTAPTSTASPSQQATMSKAVSTIQTFYADMKVAAAVWEVTHPADAAAITSAETTLDPEIAALSLDPTPTSFSAALTAIENQVNALPAGILSQDQQDELTALDFMARMLLQMSRNDPHALLPPIMRGATVQPVAIRHLEGV